jgi:hypothetical protein
MPYIQVDIELDEFDTDDLISELKDRFSRQEIKERDMKSLKILSKEVLGIATLHLPIGSNLIDTMKAEVYLENKDKFTFLELQQVLQK